MPDVGSYQLKGNDNPSLNTTSWKTPIQIRAHDGSAGVTSDASTWKYAQSVYAHNGTDWVEVWNARPEIVPSSIYFNGNDYSTIYFVGTVDPNNIGATTKFQYRRVGESTWNDSGTTTIGTGVNDPTVVTLSATISGSPFSNWEGRLYASNSAGNATSTTVYRNCTQNDGSWNTTSGYYTVYDQCSTTCDGCGGTYQTVTYYNYSKTGCPSYQVSVPGTCYCSNSWQLVTPGAPGSPSSITLPDPFFHYGNSITVYPDTFFGGYVDYSAGGSSVYVFDLYYCSSTGAYELRNGQISGYSY